jgi:hypothetical protein
VVADTDRFEPEVMSMGPPDMRMRTMEMSSACLPPPPNPGRASRSSVSFPRRGRLVAPPPFSQRPWEPTVGRMQMCL